MKSRKNESPPSPMVKIRVRERVRGPKRGRQSRGKEKLILVVLGACFGLGIGYLVASKLMDFLRPDAGDMVVQTGPGTVSGKTPRPVRQSIDRDIDFDLPSEGR